MNWREGTRPKVKLGATAATVISVAAVIYITGAAYEIANHIYEALLGTHEFFRRPVPLGIIVAVVSFYVLWRALYWHHSGPLENCWDSIKNSRLFNSCIRIWNKHARAVAWSFAAVSLVFGVALIAIALNPSPSPKEPKVAKLALSKPSDSPWITNPAQPKVPDPVQPKISEPAQPKFVDPTARKNPEQNGDKQEQVTEQNPCNLAETFTPAELAGCELDIRKHPHRKGTGGRIYILRKKGNRWVIEPLPKRPPPLQLHPQFP